MRARLISICFSLVLASIAFPSFTEAQQTATRQTTAPQEEFRVIGDMSGTEVIQKLAEIGDSDDARDITFAAIKRTNPKADKSRTSELLSVQNEQVNTVVALDKSIKPYLFATRTFGYLAPDATSSTTLVDLKSAGNIAPDTTLKGQAIKITLDRLRIYDYPGKGIHNVLFDFSGRHQAEGSAGEELRFNQTYRSPEGEGSSLTGVPVFVGLKVGNEGVFFICKTINVSNENDEKLLGYLDSPIFKRGLELLNTANPVVPIVTGFAQGIATQVASRNKNIPVQNIELGLDFSNIRARARLREGSYIAVQAPDGFDITTTQFNPATGDFVQKIDGRPIPLNYIVFSISKVAAAR